MVRSKAALPGSLGTLLDQVTMLGIGGVSETTGILKKLSVTKQTYFVYLKCFEHRYRIFFCFIFIYTQKTDLIRCTKILNI